MNLQEYDIAIYNARQEEVRLIISNASKEQIKEIQIKIEVLLNEQQLLINKRK